MDTIAGEWIMKGCRRTDSECLHSPEDLLDLVREVGFLPLFSNDIPGFSVEEHTPAEDWWVDDPARDPWAWRQLLAEIQRRKDLISQGIVHILSTQKLQQRTCPSCKRHLPWNWPYRLCDSCYGRGRRW